MLSRQAICELMPHAGSMCLLDELLEWDSETILCLSLSHLSPTNPLRSQNKLNAIHAFEYAAQAIGLHGGLLAQSAGEPPSSGMLVSLRQAQLHREYLDDTEATLTISAHRLLADSRNLLYAFELNLEHEAVAAGRAAVITQKEL